MKINYISFEVLIVFNITGYLFCEKGSNLASEAIIAPFKQTYAETGLFLHIKVARC